MSMQPPPPPSPFASPPHTSQGVRPSGWWLALGIIILVGGLGACTALLASVGLGLEDKVKELQRVQVPGTSEIQLEEGSYTLYLEYSGANDDVDPPPFEVQITAPDGTPIELDTYSTTQTYEAGRHEGAAFFSFSAPETGTYSITTSGQAGSVVAIGDSVFTDLGARAVAGIVIGIVGLIAGIVVIVVVSVKRSQSRRRQVWGAGPPPPGGYMPPGAAGPGGPPPPGGYASPPSPPSPFG